MINGISHVTLIARDLEKTAGLMVSVLGAREIYDSGTVQHSHSREKFFLIGDAWIAVMEGTSNADKSYRHIAFHVSGALDGYARALRDQGIEPLPGRTRMEGEGESLYFYDFDNQLIELHTGTLYERLKTYTHPKEADQA
jgi:catechol 2,3-dioxygenase-like lactoylglutathione lyase family enzyme